MNTKNDLTYPWAVAEVVGVGHAEHIRARLVVMGGDAPYVHFTVLDKCGMEDYGRVAEGRGDIILFPRIRM